MKTASVIPKLLLLLLLLLLSRFSRVRSCATPLMAAHQAPPSLGLTMEWVAISFSNAWKWKGKVKSVSRFRLLVMPWTAAYQAPPSMWFSRQEYWSGEPLPSLANSKFTITRRRIPQREIVATLRTLQLILWDPVGSKCFSWGLWDFL